MNLEHSLRSPIASGSVAPIAPAVSAGDVPHPGDIPTAEFREAMHRVADMLADYLDHVHEYSVIPQISPGDVRKSLPPAPPVHGEELDQILDDYKRLIEPNVTHWNHPGFMAYFAVTGSGPGILGEALSAALNVNAMLWRTGPAPTELEELVTDWIRQMMGLPAEFRGHLNDTASIGSLLALAAAREKIGGGDIRRKGMAGRSDLPTLIVYCSDQAHSSIDKAMLTLGLGVDNLRRVASDDAFRMNIPALEKAIAEDKAAGRKPIAIVATVGTTSTTSFDPVRPCAEIARREGLWLHVDGAYAGSAAICPELRPLMDGMELADSIVMNPHKWLFVPVDCSTLFVRNPEDLRRAFSIVPDYLRTTETGATNLMDFGIQLGRRFRALKLWMVLRAFGVAGLQERIRNHCRMGRMFASWVEAQPGFALAAPVPLGTVCFRAKLDGTPEQQDTFHERLVEEVNKQGLIFISHTRLRGRVVVRVTIGNLRTTDEYLASAWNLIRETRDALIATR